MIFCNLQTKKMDVYSVSKSVQTNGTYGETETIKYTQQECRLVKTDGSEVDFNDANKYYAKWRLFCDPLTIIETDVIYIDGQKYLIRSIDPCYSFSIIHHLELYIEKQL